MISIIVIGHNEGSRLSKCFNSISVILETYKNLKFELIYVDSNSSDNSIQLAIELSKEVKVFKVTGKVNAAIARNIGAKESSGDILFFVDGDMELNPDFLKYAINNVGDLKFESLTGHLDDYFYNNEGQYLSKSPRTYSDQIPSEVQQLDTNGGIFLIKRKIWEHLNGMNTQFKVNEDIDFSLRLNKLNIKTQRLPHLITKHHTIDYRDEKRMWRSLKKGYGLYPGMIFRTHLFASQVYIRIIRTQYTGLILLLLLLSMPLTTVFLVVFVLYSFLMGVRILKHSLNPNVKRKKMRYFFNRFSLQILLDISFWLGFFFFYPKKIMGKYNLVIN